MTEYNRPRLYLPLALQAGKPAPKPAPFPVQPAELRRLVAAMID